MVPALSRWQLALGLLAFASPSGVRTDEVIPSPSALDTDLTILLHNDLYANTSFRINPAIVLGGSKTFAEAEDSCKALSENLWIPLEDGKDFLKYLSFEDRGYPPGRYWVGSSSQGDCQSIDPGGEVELTDCSEQLPVLCSQSAPLTLNSEPHDTSEQWQTTIQTGGHAMTGFRDKVSFRFQGIRYAPQPPRWTYPELYEATGDSEALEFGNTCPQGLCQRGAVCSEDCLFLNVWTPYLPKSREGSKQKLRPVMFWVHGGGFEFGTGSQPTYDGSDLASRGDVVVVTINYRVNTLGFLALPDGETNGNYGFADQLVALDWVHEHIRDFGGDPDRITVFGQSAGAASVRAMLASPRAHGKYAAVISMSNLGGYNYGKTYSQYLTIEEEYELAVKPLLNAVNCSEAKDELECLKGIDASVFPGLNPAAIARYLVVDDNYLPRDHLTLDGTADVPDVPYMMGITHHDGAVFIQPPWTDNLTEALETDNFNASRIIDSGAFPMYEGDDPVLNVFNVSARVATDGELLCNDRATAYAGAKNGIFSNSWIYEFDRTYFLLQYPGDYPVCRAPKTEEHPAGDPSKWYMQCHTGELYYVFGGLQRLGVPLRDDLDIPFSQYLVDQWTSFARTHDPNPSREYLSIRGYTNTTQIMERSGKWKTMDSQNPSVRFLDMPESRHVGVDDEREQCDVLELPLDYYT